MNEELKKELKTVKDEAWKGYERSRDSGQMEAAAMFLAQVERLLTSQAGFNALMEQMNRTDEMPEYDTGIMPTGVPTSLPTD